MLLISIKQSSLEPKPTDENVALDKIELCVAQVSSWMAENFLKLNNSKTEFIILGSRQQLEKVSVNELQIGDIKVTSVDSVRNIGGWFDSTLKMDQQVNQTCKSAWNHLRNIGKIRHVLSVKETEQLIHSLVTNKIDHHNSLLFGINKTLIDRLQRVLNAAAKLVTLRRKSDHVTPILKTLHWLPVEKRIIYKMALLVYKSLHNLGPVYLKELLNWYTPSRSLRSASSEQLEVPRASLVYGTRCFAHAGPTTWNSLPLDVRQSDTVDNFKSKLKTHLFRLAYGMD